MTFQSFDSFEDMWAAMAEAEVAANERVTDEQRAIKPGDCVIRYDARFLIVGQIFTEEEFLEREIAAGPPMDDDEIADTRRQWQWRLDRGYVFGNWHSEIEPDGELGDAHISTLGPVIPKGTFETLLTKLRA